MCATGRGRVLFERRRSLAWLCLALPLVVPLPAAAASPAHPSAGGKRGRAAGDRNDQGAADLGG